MITMRPNRKATDRQLVVMLTEALEGLGDE